MDSVGKHCALQSCNALDFLPIQCSCSQWFCKLHISPDLHQCVATQHPSEPSSSARSRPKCAFSGCDKPSLETEVTSPDSTSESGAVPKGCPGCHLSFCVDHRHAQSHACTGLAVCKDDAKHDAARALLAQHFPTTGASTSHTPVVTRQPQNTSDPRKQAQLQKVHLMKLRHKAIPGDPKDKGASVPVDQRVHVTVRLARSDPSTKEMALWFRKTTPAGKALDLIAQHFGLSSMISTLHLKPLSADVDSHVLQNHLELSAQLEDGSTVVLTDSSRSND